MLTKRPCFPGSYNESTISSRIPDNWRGNLLVGRKGYFSMPNKFVNSMHIFRLGRRHSFSASMVIGGVSCVAILLNAGQCTDKVSPVGRHSVCLSAA